MVDRAGMLGTVVIRAVAELCTGQLGQEAERARLESEAGTTLTGPPQATFVSSSKSYFPKVA